MTDKDKIKNDDYSRLLWKRRLKILAGIIAGIFLCNPCSWYAVVVGINVMQEQFVLYRFTQPFFSYPLPPNTQEFSRQSGMTYGGTHACFFWGERLIATTLSEEEVKAYYGQLNFPAPHLKWESRITIWQFQPDNDTSYGWLREKIQKFSTQNLFRVQLDHPFDYYQDDAHLQACG